jgi:glutamate synthase (NADPH/NADH) large chain
MNFCPKNAPGLYDPRFEKDSCGIGFVANIRGIPSRQIIDDASNILCSMEHRGAHGYETNSGDGAGITTAIPRQFLAKIAASEGWNIEHPKHFAAGLVFLPQKKKERNEYKALLEDLIRENNIRLIGWRDLPTDAVLADLGNSASNSQPVIKQLLLDPHSTELSDFERRLFVIRKLITHQIRTGGTPEALQFYICSLSSRTLVYKGQLSPDQLFDFYPDLCDPDFHSHFGMIHARFSTNTFPSWDRAQPFRLIGHNGEVNTLRGNINWMRAREMDLASPYFKKSELLGMRPIAEENCSDSGNLDNVLELLLMSGRSLAESVMTLIPQAWEKAVNLPSDQKAFYEFQSNLMEPWDGPASITFTDGQSIGAALDRNGLRPSRYYITHDDKIVLASEVGVLNIPPSEIATKGRLKPGDIMLIDFQEGRILFPDEVKTKVASKHPYQTWLHQEQVNLENLPVSPQPKPFSMEKLSRRLVCFGYSVETIDFILLPLINEKRDPVGSMGNDEALACLSDFPKLTYQYFKQLFAQVTNPPVDPIREETAMSLRANIGPSGNLLATSKKQARRLVIKHPILTSEDFSRLSSLPTQNWHSQTLDTTWEPQEGERGLEKGLRRICDEATEAVRKGLHFLILTDRAAGRKRAPISSLLACGAVHHALIEAGLRTRVGIIVETGEAREVHHHCLLIGYGADAIYPYMAYQALTQAIGQESSEPRETVVLANTYKESVGKGILKVMAKMGISTIQSYKGAQIFEALGLSTEVVETCFKGTPSRIGGVGLNILARESLERHSKAYEDLTEDLQLGNPGEFHWRSGGEEHSWNPQAISALQIASRLKNRSAFKYFTEKVDAKSRDVCTLRGLLRFRDGVQAPIPLDKVEPAKEIVKRFCTGAMSFGSISAETHKTLAIAMNRVGGKSNTGEGGEDPERFTLLKDGDSARSAIKQVASGRFGVTMWYLTNADELQIKMAQGAKPGEGGELSGHKVDQTIARIRHSTPGVGLISPPPHHDIYSIEDLKQLIYDLKNANSQARISVKLVSEAGVGIIAAGVAKAKAEHILISGNDGGTGASPLTSIKHAGLPWELGLAETHQTLVLNKMRSRVVLQTDGGLRTGRDVTIAALLGSEEFGFSTVTLIALGCIMMRKCHLNTCPVGIATQDPVLRAKFNGQPEHVVNYLFLLAEEVRNYMARLGFSRFQDMVGRSDLLESAPNLEHWKRKNIDLSRLLVCHKESNSQIQSKEGQQFHLETRLDAQLIKECRPAIENGHHVRVDLSVKNTDRTVGTMLSSEIARKHGLKSLPEGTVHIRLTGSAGQSLAAWLVSGVTIELEGDANDYVGKGLSGGRIVIYPPAESTFESHQNVIVGNVCLYGAISGLAFIRGQAAERFCVRNSGALSVVEGVGDHGCEYMTGGRVVVLGSTGTNFAAGMSGGIAYVWDPDGSFNSRCNLGSVGLEQITSHHDDADELLNLVQSHSDLTGSIRAQELLRDWDAALGQFIRVMPHEYKRVLKGQNFAA